MEEKKYKYFDDTVIHEVLPNGLNIYLIKEEQFGDTMVNLVTKFGANKSLSTINGTVVPLGVAHFLEHRLFDYQDGDVTLLFNKMGCRINAYTAYDHTNFFFQKTGDIIEPLKLLLKFVQDFQISEENFEKEKPIICNELRMYNDSVEMKLLQDIREMMYKNHPVKYDVGGTEEDVNNTTLDQLYLTHDYFYRPDNMILVVTGKFDVDEVLEAVKEDQINRTFDSKKYRFSPYLFDEPKEVFETHRVKDYMISNNRVCFGIKIDVPKNLPVRVINKFSYIISIYCSLLFDQSSEFYIKGTEEGIFERNDYYVDTRFEDDNAGFMIIGYCSDKQKFIDHFNNYWKSRVSHIDLNNFDAIKNGKIGQIVRSLDKVDSISDYFVSNIVNDVDCFEDIEDLIEITKQDILDFDEIIEDSSISILEMNKENR